MPTDAAGCTLVAHGGNPPPFAFGVSPWEKDARRAVDRANSLQTFNYLRRPT
ncbi:MAG: hypothetical protein MET45_26975 [Nostoc sp. LLA-1]|nr:hypothetical protein [Cyanocohniella sp. LLY]